jgi:YbbR domain-containing protein
MKKLFFDNLGLKIAAVLLSVVLWIFVTSRGQSEISIDVPLEFRNIPAGLEMVNHSIKTINLNIKGQERLIKNVKAADIRVYVDLSKARKGDGIYYIDREEIKLPHAITVTNINPSSIKVTTEETISKTVKVLPVIVGEPEKGFLVRSVEVLPQYVVIEGVSSEVIKIGNVKTEPIDISALNESFSQELKIDLTGRNVRSKINNVIVKVVIGARGK